MVDNGATREVAYYIKQIHDALPKIPALLSEKSFESHEEWQRAVEDRQKAYIDFVSHIRDKAMELKTSEDAKDFFKNAVLESKYVTKEFDSSKVSYFTYYANPHSFMGERYGIRPDAGGCIDNKFYKAAKSYDETSIRAKVKSKCFLYSEDEKLINNYGFIKYNGTNATIRDKDTSRERLRIEYGNRGSSVMSFYTHNRKDSELLNPEQWKVDTYVVISPSNGLVAINQASLEEAKQTALDIERERQTHSKGNQQKRTQTKTTAYFSPLERIERTGNDYRDGKDVSPEQFLQDIEVRGGQFGNWVHQTTREKGEKHNDRQTNLNLSYDAMRDIAVALNISDKEASLGGQLALAWGARGQGNAMAHYEPVENVINLTKMKGAGSLAHEWGHALDSFLRDESKGSYFATDERDGALKDVVETMKFKTLENGRRVETDYYKNAKKLDGHFFKSGNQKGKEGSENGGYWKSDVELFARAMSCYIKDKLAEQGMKNDYLCGHADRSFPALDKATNKMYGIPINPTGEDRIAINKAIDALLEDLREKGIFHSQGTDITFKQVTTSIENELDESDRQKAAEFNRTAIPTPEKGKWEVISEVRDLGDKIDTFSYIGRKLDNSKDDVSDKNMEFINQTFNEHGEFGLNGVFAVNLAKELNQKGVTDIEKAEKKVERAVEKQMKKVSEKRDAEAIINAIRSHFSEIPIDISTDVYGEGDISMRATANLLMHDLQDGEKTTKEAVEIMQKIGFNFENGFDNIGYAVPFSGNTEHLTENQKKAAENIRLAANDYIGGLENGCLDNPIGSEEYTEYFDALNHLDDLINTVSMQAVSNNYGEMMSGSDTAKYLRDISSCGSEFILQCAEFYCKEIQAEVLKDLQKVQEQEAQRDTAETKISTDDIKNALHRHYSEIPSDIPTSVYGDGRVSLQKTANLLLHDLERGSTTDKEALEIMQKIGFSIDKSTDTISYSAPEKGKWELMYNKDNEFAYVGRKLNPKEGDYSQNKEVIPESFFGKNSTHTLNYGEQVVIQLNRQNITDRADAEKFIQDAMRNEPSKWAVLTSDGRPVYESGSPIYDKPYQGIRIGRVLDPYAEMSAENIEATSHVLEYNDSNFKMAKGFADMLNEKGVKTIEEAEEDVSAYIRMESKFNDLGAMLRNEDKQTETEKSTPTENTYDTVIKLNGYEPVDLKDVNNLTLHMEWKGDDGKDVEKWKVAYLDPKDSLIHMYEMGGEHPEKNHSKDIPVYAHLVTESFNKEILATAMLADEFTLYTEDKLTLERKDVQQTGRIIETELPKEQPKEHSGDDAKSVEATSDPLGTKSLEQPKTEPVKDQNTIIGNTPYRYIPNKSYVTTDVETAVEANKRLAEIPDLKYSGVIRTESATITVSKPDRDTVKAIVDEVKKELENSKSAEQEQPKQVEQPAEQPKETAKAEPAPTNTTISITDVNLSYEPVDLTAVDMLTVQTISENKLYTMDFTYDKEQDMVIAHSNGTDMPLTVDKAESIIVQDMINADNFEMSVEKDGKVQKLHPTITVEPTLVPPAPALENMTNNELQDYIRKANEQMALLQASIAKQQAIFANYQQSAKQAEIRIAPVAEQKETVKFMDRELEKADSWNKGNTEYIVGKTQDDKFYVKMTNNKTGRDTYIRNANGAVKLFTKESYEKLKEETSKDDKSKKQLSGVEH